MQITQVGQRSLSPSRSNMNSIWRCGSFWQGWLGYNKDSLLFHFISFISLSFRAFMFSFTTTPYSTFSGDLIYSGSLCLKFYISLTMSVLVCYTFVEASGGIWEVMDLVQANWSGFWWKCHRLDRTSVEFCGIVVRIWLVHSTCTPLLVVILHFVFGNMFHTAKRGGDVGTYGSYRVPYTIVWLSVRVSQYGYARVEQ